MATNINIRELINKIRNESPLVGRNARKYIADVLDGLFSAHTSHFGISAAVAGEEIKGVNNITPVIERAEDISRGMRISVNFANTNTHPNPRLSIGSTGHAVSITRLSNWAAGSTVDFVFDGNNWRMVGARKGTTNPLMDNVAAPGTDNGIYSAADHIHPADSHHGTSTVAADTPDKMVTGVVPTFNADLLRQGVRVSVQFTNTNTHANPTLNVGGTGARPIVNLSNWAAGGAVDFAFDGANWRMISVKSTTGNDPLMDNAATAGTDNGQVAREDHVHPAYVHHGICASAAAVARKMVAHVVPPFNESLLREGVRVSLHFVETNTHANPTLSISGSQPLPITNLSNWAAESTVDFVYGNNSWRMITPKKAGTNAPLVDLEENWSAGTDNGKLSNADHQHILYINHHARHITRGRLEFDRMPTSDTPNRVLLVRGKETSPVFAQVDLTTDVTNILPVENGGTGANNLAEARRNLNAMYDISPITGGRMVKRAVDHTRTLTENWGNSGATTADVEGWVPGAILTDAQIVFNNSVCFPTGIGLRNAGEGVYDKEIHTFPRHVQSAVTAVGFPDVETIEGKLLFTMHLPMDEELIEPQARIWDDSQIWDDAGIWRDIKKV